MSARAAHQGAAAEPRGPPTSEEELRAQLEEQLRQITVQDVLRPDDRQPDQPLGPAARARPDTRRCATSSRCASAIEAVRALLPLLEQESAEQMRPVRDALTQLQLAYARETGAAAGGPEPEAPSRRARKNRLSAAGGTGGLWVPPGTQT